LDLARRCRCFGGFIALLALVGGPNLRADTGPRLSLFVYLHTAAKSIVVEDALKERLPGLEVTVFSRFTDLEDALNKRHPDAVLGQQPLLASMKIPVALQGLRDNSEREPYVLLSANADLAGDLSGHTIGVVDLMGRTGTQEFVGRLLKTPDLKFKRVTKMEDLLPLLQFFAAEAILVPAAAVEGLKARSRLPLRVRPLPDALVGLPALGLVNPAAGRRLVGQLQGLDAATNRILGVDRWRAP
jgi:hypothetical protein